MNTIRQKSHLVPSLSTAKRDRPASAKSSYPKLLPPVYRDNQPGAVKRDSVHILSSLRMQAIKRKSANRETNPVSGDNTVCTQDTRAYTQSAVAAVADSLAEGQEKMPKQQTLSKKFGVGWEFAGDSVLFDKNLFENEINRAQISNFLKIYNYRDIKFYMNIYQDFKKSDLLEISSYWMGILDGPIKSRFQDYDLNRLLDNETFRHNLKFCLVLFIYNPNVEYVVRQKVNFPLIVYPLKKFNYFTNETDLLFEWNERLELFVIGYEFDVMHYATEIPNYFTKHWLIFEDDFPLRLSDFCVENFGINWRDTLQRQFNVCVKFLACDTKANAQRAYETCFRMYKQCIYYKSYDISNVEKYNSNWYYECFTNGTPILTTDESDFDFYDYFDNSYNLRWTKELATQPHVIRELFNTKNITKMSGLIYSWKKFILDSKTDIVDYFRYVHFNLFKMRRSENKFSCEQQLLL